MEKAAYAYDLHCHTTRSDGADTPIELVDNAVKRGVKGIAITDHDIVPPKTVILNGKEIDICEYAASKDLAVIKGIEISCETEVEDVHIICFHCDWEAPFFTKLQKDVTASKIESYRLLVERLREDGIDVTWKEVLENNGTPVAENSVQKKMIFELLARKGAAEDWSKAKLMVKNTKRYQIKRKKPDPVAVIKEIKHMGGYTIMAHPFLVNEPVMIEEGTMDRFMYIERLIDAGLDGIEGCYTYDKTSYGGELPKEEIEEIICRTYSKRLRLISGGSDYHADYRKNVKNPRQLGECGVTEAYFMSNEILRNLV